MAKSHKIIHVSQGALFLAIVLTLFMNGALQAKPSQSDVFKSIQDNVGKDSDTPTDALPWIGAGVVVIIICVVVSRRQAVKATPRVVNNPGRLMREVMNQVDLSPRDVKQLKLAAEEVAAESESESEQLNPLVLVLCPSLLVKIANDKETKADRKSLVAMLKRMGIR